MHTYTHRIRSATICTYRPMLPMSCTLTHGASVALQFAHTALPSFLVFPNIVGLSPNFSHGGKNKMAADRNLLFICDMIKRNESDVGDVHFEILACFFYCFWQLQIIHNSCNQISNCNGVCIKMKHFGVVINWCNKIEIEILDKWIISLDHMSHISRLTVIQWVPQLV